jgi:hypothetical protein
VGRTGPIGGYGAGGIGFGGVGTEKVTETSN